jgi:hypothetical protein
VKTAKNSKLPKLPENCFEPVGKGGWPPISTYMDHNVVEWFLEVIINPMIISPIFVLPKHLAVDMYERVG